MHLSVNFSKSFLFRLSDAWLILIEDSVKVYVNFSAVVLFLSVTGSKTFLSSRENFAYVICLVIELLPLDF